ncbi:MAG TPA: alpha/beta fold hydrolase [Thermoanaerobaculia bacterium]|jgi:pimeloyl-ACP methyl ester carboxylesterase|nr:alpha/beta fold hydrolase [Thermoanaerobaculia bacterium]
MRRFFAAVARGFFLLCGVLLPLGCARYRPTPVPLRTVQFPGTGQPRTLVVLLPGRHDAPQDFGRAGFPEMAARAGARVDMVAADAHLGYYLKNLIIDRLHEDVIAPARRRYERIWLVGISIGGAGAVAYASRHPENVDGVVLLAPFLGQEEVIGEVAAGGGLRRWKPPEPLAPDDYQRQLWAWLSRYASGSQGRIPLYLGFGTCDSFARANGLLAEVLPPERVFTVAGGHDWKAWRALWADFVRTGALGTGCARAAVDKADALGQTAAYHELR